ncbi:MAG TPA: Uma2 family endonuclease [Pirellulales bacterium]|jgi:Uma2 family endonuclease|nr:Uma2 family endonuclease [Pirellulales bacterium]
MNAAGPLTLQQYEQLIESGAFHPRGTARIELIYGRMLGTACSECEAVHAVNRLLNEWIFRLRLPRGVWTQIKAPVALALHQSMPEPDIAWIAEPDGSKRRPDACDVFLLIEVAESSLAYYRGEKADLYAAAGIKDYWIVNLPDKCVEVRREPRDGRYRSVESFGPGAEVAPLAFPELALPVALLFPDK